MFRRQVSLVVYIWLSIMFTGVAPLMAQDEPLSRQELQGLFAQNPKVLKHHQAAEMPLFLDIAKNADGSVKYLNQAEAIEYCACKTDNAREKLGCRTTPGQAYLPTARELAQLSMSLGAKGIMDSCDSVSKCYQVEVVNLDGSSDSFNYSYAGFPRLAKGDPAHNGFWSSSVEPNNFYKAFLIYGDMGHFIRDDYRVRDVAVRCVSGR